MKKVSLFLTLFAMAFGFVSCEEEVATVDVKFYNNGYTEATLTVDGEDKTVAADGMVTFEIEEGAEFTFEGVTQGAKGIEITWGPLNLTAEADETQNSYDIDVAQDYFFLGIAHDKAGEADIDRLVVNKQDDMAKTDEEVYIPQDGVVYDVGYYKALTGNYIYAYHAGTGDFWKEGNFSSEYYFQYPGEINQGVDLYTNDLRLLKKKKATRTSTNKSLLSN